MFLGNTSSGIWRLQQRSVLPAARLISSSLVPRAPGRLSWPPIKSAVSAARRRRFSQPRQQVKQARQSPEQAPCEAPTQPGTSKRRRSKSGAAGDTGERHDAVDRDGGWRGGGDREGEGNASPSAEPSAADNAAGSGPSQDDISECLKVVDRIVHAPARRHGPGASALSPVPFVYPHRRETSIARYKSETFLAHKHNLQEGRPEKQVTWQQVLAYLVSTTPACEPEHAHVIIQILLPQDSVEAVLFGYPMDVWDLCSQTGCRAELHPSRPEHERQPRLFVFGDARSIFRMVEGIRVLVTGDLVIRKLDASHPAVTNRPRPLETTNRKFEAVLKLARSGVLSTPLAAGQYRAPADRRVYALKQHVDAIPPPKTWTKTSLEAYVAKLTFSRLGSDLRRVLYPGPQAHAQAVVHRLVTLFRSPEVDRAVSSTAFKTALAFMVRQAYNYIPRLVPLEFVHHAERWGYQRDTEVFNLLAERDVKDRNLDFFMAWLRAMTKRGLHPSSRTWLLFNRLIKVEGVRRWILLVAKSKGLLYSSNVTKNLAIDMALDDTHRAIVLGRSLDEFLQEQSRVYGSEWLSLTTANRILNVLGRYGRYDDMVAFLQTVMLTSTCARPNRYTLNIILARCRAQSQLFWATRFLRMLTGPDVGARPDKVTLDLLFKMGREHDHMHLVSVTYRYAHLTNLASSQMRQRGGLLAEGTDHDFGAHLVRRFPGLTLKQLADDLFRVDMDRDCARAATSTTAAATAAKAHEPVTITSWYMMQFLKREPTVPLADLVDQALLRDQALHRDKAHGEGEPSWGPAIRIPTKKRARPLLVQPELWPAAPVVDNTPPKEEDVRWVGDDSEQMHTAPEW